MNADIKGGPWLLKHFKKCGSETCGRYWILCVQRFLKLR